MVLLGAIDQGTSSSRFLVFESDTGDMVASHQIEVKQLYPEEGWVEMDPEEIYSTVADCMEQVCVKLDFMGVNPKELAGIGIANQRETVVVWDKHTGRPLYNAIVWLDTRTAQLAEEYIERTPIRNKDYFKKKTGLPIHPYFSALKLRWLINNVTAVQKALDEGSLLFGTVDSWLLWKLTGRHITDMSNASRTLLIDLHKQKWSSELCKFFEIPMEILPKICSSAEVYGPIKHGFLEGVRVAGCLGDQQSAMVGHGCLRPGEGKNTYGTGTFMLVNTGGCPVLSKHGLLTTVGFKFGNEAICYALEGSGSIGGNVVRFLRDNFNFIKESSGVESLAASVPDTAGVYFVPCFTGLFTPYWDATARGTICGLTHCATRGHIALAALKAVTFQTAEMIEAVEQDIDGLAQIKTLRVDGGMTANLLFNQLQSDAVGRSIVCSRMAEISGWGAAVAAAIGIGHFTLDEYSAHANKSMMIRFYPKNTDEERCQELNRWKEAVKRARNWVEASN